MEYIRLAFGYLLSWLYQLTNNYGLALIIFAIAVKLMLWTLTPELLPEPLVLNWRSLPIGSAVAACIPLAPTRSHPSCPPFGRSTMPRSVGRIW